MAEVGPSVALILQVGPRLSGWIGLLQDALTAAWPGHPPLIVAVPPGSEGARRPEHFECSEPDWVGMLRETLLHIRDSRPGIRKVFTLIDDHCPLRPCDAGGLSSVLDLALAEDMKCVAFVTYAWPWDHTEPESIDSEGRRMTWREARFREAGDHRFAIVPVDFFRYYQCQPALWDLDYLLAICDRALSLGLRDPWSFEALVPVEPPPHYISEMSWPTVHHGFLASGKVNPEAALFLRPWDSASRALANAIFRDFRAQRGPFPCARARVRNRYLAARRILGGLKRRLS